MNAPPISPDELEVLTGCRRGMHVDEARVRWNWHLILSMVKHGRLYQHGYYLFTEDTTKETKKP